VEQAPDGISALVSAHGMPSISPAVARMFSIWTSCWVLPNDLEAGVTADDVGISLMIQVYDRVRGKTSGNVIAAMVALAAGLESHDWLVRVQSLQTRYWTHVLGTVHDPKRFWMRQTLGDSGSGPTAIGVHMPSGPAVE